MKRVLALCLGLLALGMASLTVTGSASAALPEDCPNYATHPPNDLGPDCEEAHTTFTVAPRKGGFYKEAPVPSNWQINVQVDAPYVNPGPPPAPQPDVLPLKKVDLMMPTDISFNPDPKMPVCTDSMYGPDSNQNQPPAAIIALCPNSVIGNGSAWLYISHKNTPSGPNIKDPTLIVFNAGRVASGPLKGRPKIKISGFSKATSAGIYMEGVLEKSGKLTINVPPLSNDSAVSRFDLNIPAPNPIKYNNITVPQSVGQDPNYLRTKCSTGNWLLTSEFTLGTRTQAGDPISPSTVLDAPDFNLPCTGAAGAAKLGKMSVSGPASVKKGKTGAYKVKVSNTGTATAKAVKVTAAGKGAKGSATVGNLAPGAAKTVTVKVKFTTKGKSKVTFTAKGSKGGSAKAVKTVTVK